MLFHNISASFKETLAIREEINIFDEKHKGGNKYKQRN